MIAAYLPNRPAPENLDGLRKNLRLGSDQRYRWHWDPRFIAGRRSLSVWDYTSRLIQSARRLTVPTLLVRGLRSEVVADGEVQEFLALAPHAQYIALEEAGHMVAGDQNDRFSGAVVKFLESVPIGRPIGLSSASL